MSGEATEAAESEWVEWMRWGAPELARRITALDPTPVRRGATMVGGPVAGSRSPARDAVIALAQDAAATVREREALHRGVLRAGIARLGLTAGCDFLAATAAEVLRADPDTLWGTGRAVTRLLARCDQVEGLADEVRVIRGLDAECACPGCGGTVVAFDGERARCVLCRESWFPLRPILAPVA